MFFNASGGGKLGSIVKDLSSSTSLAWDTYKICVFYILWGLSYGFAEVTRGEMIELYYDIKCSPEQCFSPRFDKRCIIYPWNSARSVIRGQGESPPRHVTSSTTESVLLYYQTNLPILAHSRSVCIQNKEHNVS